MPIEIIDIPKRRNGFDFPLSIEQVSVWILIVLNIIHYSLGTQQHLNAEPGEVTAQLFTLLFLVLSFLLGFITTYVDSEDEIIPLQQSMSKLGHVVPVDKTNYFCHVCKLCVHEGTKHCRTCNKCIREFDHHCKWVNNCVGLHNYKYFLGFIACTVIALACKISLLALALKEEPEAAMKVTAIIMIVLNSLVLLPIGELLRFHIYISCLGKTTFQYLRDTEGRKASKVNVRRVQD